MSTPPNNPDLESTKLEICEIGRRIYGKGFSAANEGNISVRTGKNEVICTPTLICKGFMTPDDLCTVDILGNQLAGKRKRTSEVLLHLEIYRQRPDIRSIVHCHPPHVNAFGIAREPIPTCILPEPEIFLGEVPIADYETPNTQNFADSILPFVHKTNIIVLANHGTVSYDTDVERAYWLTEILDAYCRSLILAKQLGNVEYLSTEQGRELLEARQAWGFEDPRWAPDEPIDVRDFVSFKSTWAAAGLKQRAFGNSVQGDADNDRSIGELDQLVEKIAERVFAKIKDASIN